MREPINFFIFKDCHLSIKLNRKKLILYQCIKQPANQVTIYMSHQIIIQYIEVNDKSYRIKKYNKPNKKDITGFILYYSIKYDQVLDVLVWRESFWKNPYDIRKLAENWKALSEEEQAVWNEKAKTISEDP